MCELLGVSSSPHGDGVRLAAVTQPWMANVLGFVHGGILASMIGQAVSFVGELHTTPDADHQVGELSISFLRSPRVDGQHLTIDARADRVGRRVASVGVTMRSGDQVQATATAEILFRRD